MAVFEVTRKETTPIDGQKPGTSGLRKKDFGIKYNMENGGPAPEAITDKIYANTKTIKEYLVAEDLPDVDISAIGVTNFTGPEGSYDVEVFDSATDYVELMKSIFDFESIRKLLASPNFTFWFFVTPSDSVAIIVANAVQSIPYFSSGLKGVARSMPTSAALDVVAQNLGLEFFEVPTGWKFFGNLMDAGLCSICGEESFGTGSDHIREKDGIWAVLAWLSILAYKNKDNLNGDNLVTVEDIVHQHWVTYGRHFYTRYDYENVDAAGAKELMSYLVNLQSSLQEVNKIIKGIRSDVSDVVDADEFEYKDPVDGSVSKHQGLRYFFADGSRLVFRLSGTGSEGATIRLYIEQYEKDPSKTWRDSQEALAPLVEVAIKLSKMQDFTGRSAPTVIT